MKTVTFCGHGDCTIRDDVKRWLYEAIETEIKNGAEQFYLGGYGAFDRIAAQTVWELKQKYPHIKSILVLAYLDRKVDAKYYDETTYPPLENTPLRFAILKRNEWMIREADVVIAYVLHSWGGAAQTLKHAQRKNKRIRSYEKEMQQGRAR